ncbi:MAG: vWA domain-containing protein [Bacteroidales bacterium]
MRYKYSKFTGDIADELNLEDLVSQLSDLLLFSGFGDNQALSDPDTTMQALHDAILDALLKGDLLSQDTLERLLGDSAQDGEEQADQIEELIKQLIERLEQQGYVTTSPGIEQERQQRQERTASGAGVGPDAQPTRFQVTDKALDFLGYRALRDLLGSLGKSSFGRHDTRDLATGVEAISAPKPYEFGDTMNIDPSSTILNAVVREGLAGEDAQAQNAALGDPPFSIHVDYPDLMVAQGEYQSSCATVLMLDCSHSMILYGEDRFTPAKRVALALANLIRTQYPGDGLHVVLFHDSAEEIHIKELARVRVGPYYTNTREGLKVARRILDRERKDMRQIIMITDGKPSALTRPDGRIYKNAFGLDPLIVSETLAEVAACRRSGIMVNTFMLAKDYDLVSFVKKVAEICRGKAYFTTPYTLGQYVLMDYMSKKSKKIH